jgi:glyoxylase-like metal-dependent hydrolase (beta-lactamase superfamily II)/ferredoxin
MADPRKKLPLNVEGEFFVDSTCIDCDACRQIAPGTFAEGDDASFVQSQPIDEPQRRQAFRALLSCPTGSIGTTGVNLAGIVKNDFPLPIESGVFYCGFNSPKSFGGNSYFIRHPDGNWLIDSPKFLPHLVKKIAEVGGLSHIFLTHRDDVADAERFAKHFNARRIIHRRELSSQPGAEIVLDGERDLALGRDFLVIPTPGHTAGHCVLLYRDRFLFTGDHLDWDRDLNRLHSSENYCWYSWDEQIKSVRKLLQYSFEWVLPGHGQSVQLPAEQIRNHLANLVARISDAAVGAQ